LACIRHNLDNKYLLSFVMIPPGNHLNGTKKKQMMRNYDGSYWDRL